MSYSKAGQINQGVENLTVWQKAIDLAEFVVRQVIPQFPPEEKYVLVNQLRRSVYSIPANIAEGHGRFYYQESVRFCYIARGSLEETRTFLILARRLEYISENLHNELDQVTLELRRMLNGYIAYLKQSKRGGTELSASIREDSEEYTIDVFPDNP